MTVDIFDDVGNFARKLAAKNRDFGRKVSRPEGDSSLYIPYAVAIDIRNNGLIQLLPLRGRAWMAVCDAMQGAKLATLDTPFFVAPKVAARWNLTPDQLNRGLNALTALGLLTTVEKKRGRYRRIRLVLNHAH
jgi:hypothetical protein